MSTPFAFRARNSSRWRAWTRCAYPKGNGASRRFRAFVLSGFSRALVPTQLSTRNGQGGRARTCDFRYPRQDLYLLSYTLNWLPELGSNQRPNAYQAFALPAELSGKFGGAICAYSRRSTRPYRSIRGSTPRMTPQSFASLLCLACFIKSLNVVVHRTLLGTMIMSFAKRGCSTEVLLRTQGRLMHA